MEYENEVEAAKPLTSFDPIPAGRYQAVIIESEAKPTQNGGERLALKWQIIEGEHEGRYVFDNINLKNANPKAVEIGMRQLKAIAIAVGHNGRLSDSAELHDQPCYIDVKVTPERTDPKNGKTYDPGNEIKMYEPIEGAAAPTAARAAVPPPQKAVAKPAPATPARKPWERK
jgi:hypothetical protein